MKDLPPVTVASLYNNYEIIRDTDIYSNPVSDELNIALINSSAMISLSQITQ